MSCIVTGTVKDPNSNVYRNAVVRANFTPNPSVPPGSYYGAGGTSPFPMFANANTDSFGFFSLTIEGLDTISPAGATWTFTITSNTNPIVGFSLNTALITGTTVDISASIQAAAAPLPLTSFGNISTGNITATGNISLSGNLIFTGGSPSVTGNITLSGNLTLSGSNTFSGTNSFTGSPQFKSDPWFDVRQYGAKCDWNGTTGTDDTTAIQAAINAAHALNTNATVYIPAVQGCKFTSQLTVFNSIAIIGPSGITENTPALVYTGTGATSAITGGATGVSNFTMRNVVVQYTSGSFTGVLLDLSSNQTGNQNWLEGVTLTGGNGSIGGGQNSASYLLSLASSIGTHLFNCHIGGGSNGINLSNAFGTKIYFCVFETIYGKITNKYLDAGATTGCSSCGFVGCIFEHFSATNSTIDLDCSGSGCFGSTFIDNFLGDFPNNWAGNVIKTPSAMIIAGNTFSGPTVGTGGTLIQGGANGMSFTGNYITSGGIWATALNNMGGATNLNVIANAWSGTITTFLSGTPSSGVIVDNSTPAKEQHFGPIITAVGAVGAPAYTFIGNLTTGWWLNSSNQVEVSVAGNGMIAFDSNAHIIGRSNLVYGFSPGAPESNSNDSGISRDSAGVIDFGNGTAADTTGKIQAAGYISKGTTFTASGCTNSTLVGGATAGKFTVGQATNCSVTITMGNSATAPNGWTCAAYDITNAPTLAIRQTAQNTTSCTLNMTVATNDVIVFSAKGW